MTSEENGANVLLDDVIEANHPDFVGMSRSWLGDGANDSVQVGCMQDVLVRAFHESLGYQRQLGEIAKPGQSARGIQEVRGKLRESRARPGSEALHEAGKKLRNVLAAFAQGWNRDAQRSKEIRQIRGEVVRAHQRSKAALGEGNDAGSLWSVSAYQAKQCCLGDGSKLVGTRDIEHAN